MECLLCYRENVVHYSNHHLVPKQFGGEETIEICSDCHNAIHARYSNQELEERFYSLELIMLDCELRKAFKFLRKQDPSRRFRNKQSNQRRKKGKYG